MGSFVPTGLCLAVLSHIFCARYSMFAAKLLTHMLAASLGTQVGERGISHFHAMFISSVILELSV